MRFRVSTSPSDQVVPVTKGLGHASSSWFFSLRSLLSAVSPHPGFDPRHTPPKDSALHLRVAVAIASLIAPCLPFPMRPLPLRNSLVLPAGAFPVHSFLLALLPNRPTAVRRGLLGLSLPLCGLLCALCSCSVDGAPLLSAESLSAAFLLNRPTLSSCLSHGFSSLRCPGASFASSPRCSCVPPS
ncbi:hypothetical protein TRVL_08303 [Trypanosoma vivax]|nr:hypothetical protein TRVL_08303 [Trypanosoma vivax]